MATPVTVDTRTVPVTLLRAGAAVLGAYGYVLGLWLARLDLDPEPVATIRTWVSRPLGLGEDFGPFALMLLLAATGYAAGSTGGRPARLVRVCLPALLGTVGVCLLGYDDAARLPVFLPLFLIGLLTWWVVDGTLPAWAGVPLGVVCFALVIAVHHAFPGLQPWWYPIAATFAVLLFLVVVRPGPTTVAVAAHPVTRWLAAVAEVPFLVSPIVVLLVGA